jgi:murein DD-endopeptidase MepM/ murein hydrolase activator NlpD
MRDSMTMPSRKYVLVSAFLAFKMLTNTTTAQETGWHKTSTPSIYISAIINSELGIFACENDGRLWANPYNGCYLSIDLGNSWVKKGLAGRGVTDIFQSSELILATTTYTKEQLNGLFSYNTQAGVWEHLGNNFSTSSVSFDGKTIYLGTYSQGLWTSEDNGISWEQKITEPLIRTIKSTKNKTLISSSNKTFSTTDNGKSWNEVTNLNGKVVYHLWLEEQLNFASTSEGIYKSIAGDNWDRLEESWNFGHGAITKYKGVIYAGVKDLVSNSARVYSSANKGFTWNDKGLFIDNFSEINSMDWVFTKPPLLFANVTSNGIYKYEITETDSAIRFLGDLWQTDKPTEHYERIYSFFDHKYPFLGTTFVEPAEERDTTINLYGFRAKEPFLFYSSHNGTDFTLPYDTQIKVPADGYATYTPCIPCGNAITIDHKNGYQTTYMHLQNNELITNSDIPIRVTKGDVLGRVGMTGNTTGPHLHFEVTKDTNANDIFSDENPQGKVDPFGWSPADNTSDPWAQFSQDGISGSESKLLWINSAGQDTFISEPTTMNLENRSVIVEPQIATKPLTISLSIPGFFHSINGLSYIPNSSINIKALDQLGNVIRQLNSPVGIKVNIPTAILTQYVQDSIKIFLLDEKTYAWTPLETINDRTEDTLSAETMHLSTFATFGQKANNTLPRSEISIIGNKDENWYVSKPTVTIYSLGSNTNKLFYTTDGEIGWKEYTEPFEMQSQGINKLIFRALAIDNEVEMPNEQIVMINTMGKETRKLSIKEATIAVSSTNYLTNHNTRTSSEP